MSPTSELEPVLVVYGFRPLAAPAILRLAGYRVESVPTGAHALARAGERRFAVIVVDRRLVDMDSLDLCLRLRSRGDWTPIILLAVNDSIDDRVRALDAGADDYASMHVAHLELVARVRALCRRRRPVARQAGRE